MEHISLVCYIFEYPIHLIFFFRISDERVIEHSTRTLNSNTQLESNAQQVPATADGRASPVKKFIAQKTAMATAFAKPVEPASVTRTLRAKRAASRLARWRTQKFAAATVDVSTGHVRVTTDTRVRTVP